MATKAIIAVADSQELVAAISGRIPVIYDYTALLSADGTVQFFTDAGATALSGPMDWKAAGGVAQASGHGRAVFVGNSGANITIDPDTGTVNGHCNVGHI